MLKTIRFTHPEAEEIKSFMKIVRNRETARIYGQTKIGISLSLAAKYLFKSKIDRRYFKVIGTFSRCMIELDKNSQDIKELGKILNSAVQDINSGQTTKIDFEDLFSQLDDLLEINSRILEEFEQSFGIGEE